VWRSAFDDALLGMMLADPTGRFTRANRAACELLGYTEDELLAHDVVSLTHPDDRELTRRNLARMRAGEISEVRSDKRYLRKDGSAVWVQLGQRAVRDDNGEIACLISQIPDISDRRAAEEALRESEERFRRLVENARDLVMRYRLVPEPGFDYVSPSLLPMLGYTPEEFYADAGLGIETIHPDDRAAVFAAYERDPEAPVTARAVRKDGTVLWMERREIAVRDESGEIVALEAIVRDVTERVAREQRLRAIFDGASDAMLLADDERRYLDANAAAAELFGIPVSEIIGRTIDELVGTDGVDEKWDAFVEGGTDTGERTITRPDGTVRWVEFRATANIEPGRHLAMLRDVTDRRLAEHSLRETQELYRLVVENTADLVALVDLEGTFVFASPSFATVLGYEPEELVGTNAIELVVEEDRARSEANIARGTASPAAGVYGVWAKDGRVIHLEGRITPIAGPSGQPHLILSTSRDISERVRAEKLDEQLRQADKMKAVGQVAAGVAHDFNNLLTVINGYSDLAMESADPRTHEHLREIRRAGEQAASLTRQLLAFSRKQVLRPEPIDLDDLLSEQSNMLGRVLGDDIEVVVERAIEPAIVLADRTQVVQVVLNLAVNARDAMPNGGRMTLRTRTADPYVALDVIDVGTGIEPKILDRLFEPFFTTKPTGLGTGLGLSTVVGIVEQSGGFVDVRTKVGGGSTFSIFLPRAEQATTPTARAEPDTTVGGGAALLVEDNSVVRPLVERFLTMLGFDVVSAGSPRQALELVETTGPFEILLTDVVMPEMTGDVLAARLRARLPELSVIYMSGYTAEAVIDRGALDRGESFLQKPFTIAQLAQAVRSARGTA